MNIAALAANVLQLLIILAVFFIRGLDLDSLVIFLLLTLLMGVSTIMDNLFMGAGARKGGASWGTIALALFAGVLGTIIFPPIGGLIAAPLAVYLLEYARLKDSQQAWQALRGLATGWGLSFLARFGIGSVMMVLWWIWVWKG